MKAIIFVCGEDTEVLSVVLQLFEECGKKIGKAFQITTAVSSTYESYDSIENIIANNMVNDIVDECFNINNSVSSVDVDKETMRKIVLSAYRAGIRQSKQDTRSVLLQFIDIMSIDIQDEKNSIYVIPTSPEIGKDMVSIYNSDTAVDKTNLYVTKVLAGNYKGDNRDIVFNPYKYCKDKSNAKEMFLEFLNSPATHIDINRIYTDIIIYMLHQVLLK